MKVLTLIAGLLCLAIGSGCASPLADASFAVQSEFHGAVTQFGVIAETFSVHATTMADKKHEVQQALQVTELAAIYAAHQNEAGELVLTPEDFAEMTALIISGQAAITTSKARFDHIRDRFVEATRMLRDINASTLLTAESIHETEKSVQAFTTKVTQAIGAIVAGAAVAF